MPNVKIYVDQSIYDDREESLRELLPKLRVAVSEGLNAKVSACQFAVIPVMGLPDQPVANLEIYYVSTAARTKDMVTAACETLRDLLAEVVGGQVAVRATPIIPETYVALK